MTRFKAAVFDMDGLLIDSEPHWDVVIDAVLGELGVVLDQTMRLQTTGMRLEETLGLWRIWFPDALLEKAHIGKRLAEVMMERMERVSPKPGAVEVIRMCREAGCRLAVASSSPASVIAAGLARLGVAAQFDAVISADGEPHGKPHPAVFLSAARALGVPPADCIAFEDSLNGTKAAVAAGMYCVAVPEGHNLFHAGYDIAHRKLGSLADFRAEFLADG